MHREDIFRDGIMGLVVGDPRTCGKSGEKDNGNGSLMRILFLRESYYRWKDRRYLEKMSPKRHGRRILLYQSDIVIPLDENSLFYQIVLKKEKVLQIAGLFLNIFFRYCYLFKLW